MAVSSDKVRVARAFLRKRGISTAEVSPRRFAAAAAEHGDSFERILAFIRRLYQGQQGAQQQRREQIEAAVKSEV